MGNWFQIICNGDWNQVEWEWVGFQLFHYPLVPFIPWEWRTILPVKATLSTVLPLSLLLHFFLLNFKSGGGKTHMAFVVLFLRDDLLWNIYTFLWSNTLRILGLLWMLKHFEAFPLSFRWKRLFNLRNTHAWYRVSRFLKSWYHVKTSWKRRLTLFHLRLSFWENWVRKFAKYICTNIII